MHGDRDIVTLPGDVGNRMAMHPAPGWDVMQHATIGAPHT
jgi:hypothetical protein